MTNWTRKDKSQNVVEGQKNPLVRSANATRKLVEQSVPWVLYAGAATTGYKTIASYMLVQRFEGARDQLATDVAVLGKVAAKSQEVVTAKAQDLAFGITNNIADNNEAVATFGVATVALAGLGAIVHGMARRLHSKPDQPTMQGVSHVPSPGA